MFIFSFFFSLYQTSFFFFCCCALGSWFAVFCTSFFFLFLLLFQHVRAWIVGDTFHLDFCFLPLLFVFSKDSFGFSLKRPWALCS